MLEQPPLIDALRKSYRIIVCIERRDCSRLAQSRGIHCVWTAIVAVGADALGNQIVYVQSVSDALMRQRLPCALRVVTEYAAKID